ncbi:hypothetical protein EAF04_002799 [Stromatinia cepivora]|nr:hypothetical protein EAF04_002799 [Stromatinia cepivora]
MALLVLITASSNHHIIEESKNRRIEELKSRRVEESKSRTKLQERANNGQCHQIRKFRGKSFKTVNLPKNRFWHMLTDSVNKLIHGKVGVKGGESSQYQ